jgi:phage baseplate assembly protein W
METFGKSLQKLVDAAINEAVAKALVLEEMRKISGQPGGGRL